MLTTHVHRRPASVLFSAALAFCLLETHAFAAAQAPKYYARVVEVVGSEDKDLLREARTALEKELATRPVFTTDLGGEAATPATLEAHRLRGFDVSLRFESITRELKDPRPGRRLKQLALGVRISVFGSDIVDGKMAFSGEGESMQLIEVNESRLDKEAGAVMPDVLSDAIAQAVDQAVLKLSLASHASEAKAKQKKRSGKNRR